MPWPRVTRVVHFYLRGLGEKPSDRRSPTFSLWLVPSPPRSLQVSQFTGSSIIMIRPIEINSRQASHRSGTPLVWVNGTPSRVRHWLRPLLDLPWPRGPSNMACLYRTHGQAMWGHSCLKATGLRTLPPFELLSSFFPGAPLAYNWGFSPGFIICPVDFAL